MIYRGRIEHGVVVVDAPAPLPDGTELEISVISNTVPRAVGQGLETLAGTAQGLPEDLAENHDRYRRGTTG
jgi:hypothetical protein